MNKRSYVFVGVCSLIVGCGQHKPEPGIESQRAELAPSVPQACVVGTTRLEIGDRSTTTGGAATDNLTLGSNARITGPVNVFGDALLRPGGSINGNLDISGTLTEQTGPTQVTGTVTRPGTAVQAALPQRSVTVGTTAVTVVPGPTRTLEPGNYAAAYVQARARLTLGAGTYNFSSLSIEGQSVVTLDTSGGPIAINVQGNVTIFSGAQIAAGDPALVTLFSNGATVNVEPNTAFPGTLIAPSARVTVSNGVTINGCLGGARVTVGTDGRITGTGSITVGPTPGDGGVEIPDVIVPPDTDAGVEVPDVIVPPDTDAGVEIPDVIVPPDTDAGVEIPDVIVPPDTDAGVEIPDVIVPPDADAGKSPLEVKQQVNPWQTGYCANVTIQNKGTTTVSTWSAALTMNESRLTRSWSAVFTPGGAGNYTLTPEKWNAVLAPNATANFGFCADKTGPNFEPIVTVK